MADTAAGNDDRPGNIVVRALMNYIGEGCTLVHLIDNFYSNMDLLQNKNHLVDVLRQNVKGVPQDVLQNTKMKKRGIVGKGSNTGIVVASCEDKRNVTCISTRHGLEMANMPPSPPKVNVHQTICYLILQPPQTRHRYI